MSVLCIRIHIHTQGQSHQGRTFRILDVAFHKHMLNETPAMLKENKCKQFPYEEFTRLAETRLGTYEAGADTLLARP